MQKLFIEYTPADDKITLTDEQARHIGKSLRMKIGDMLMVTAGNGVDYGCQISDMTKDTVTLDICYEQASKSEPSVEVTIYQGVPKGTKMEDIVQKCVELGVTRIVPTLTNRCVSRPDEKSAQKKNVRYQKIALEAAQQSGRGIVPEIAPMMTLKQAIANDDAEAKIIFYEGGGEPLKDIITPSIKSVSIYIGSEGGFDADEVEMIVNAGATKATLGPRILRTQTAPVCALSCIMMLTDNLS